MIITGNLRLAGYEPWLNLAQVNAGDPLPLQLVIAAGSAAAQEVSLSRHAGWPAYIRRTGLLFPRRRRPRRGA